MVNVVAFVCVITLSLFVVVSADSGNVSSADDLEEEFSNIVNNKKVDNDGIDSIDDSDPTVTETDSTDDRLPSTKAPESATNRKRKAKGKESKNKSALNMTSTTKMPKLARTMMSDEENDNIDLRNGGNLSREDSLDSDGKSIAADEGTKTTCASLPEIEGAIIPRVEGTDHALGKSVTYSCNFGYVSRNTINHISTCVFNEITGKAEWTIPEIACIPQSCGDPGNVNNGRRIGSLFTFPNKVDYECDEGYKLRGLRTRYCQARGEWSGRLPSCEIIYCAAPPDPINGRAIYSSLEYGAVLSYECNIGLFLSNDQPRFCTDDGSWSGDEPECTGEVRCTEPTAPDHGTVNLSGLPKVGSIARYSCDPDKMLLGASNVKCLITGQWTFDTPKCLSFCFVPYIENGEMGQIETQVTTKRQSHKVFKKFSEGERVKHNEILTLRCRNGFSPAEELTSFNNNEVEVNCNDGTWSKVLQCKQTFSSCPGNPPPIKDGFPVINSREHGYTIWYKCNNKRDFKVEGNVTCHFGSWIGIPPKCLKNPCDMADLNYPGLVKPSDGKIASTESFDIKCDDGFRKSSSVRKITCVRGKWDITQNPCSEDRDQDGIVLTPLPMTLVEKQHRQAVKPDTSTFSRPEECFCVKDYNDNRLIVRSGDKILKIKDKVRQGETISFSCKDSDRFLTWPNGLRLFGKANMTCNTCEIWQRDDHPYCRKLKGEPVIEYEGNLTVLKNGVLVGIKMRNIRLTGIANEQSHWYFGGKLFRSQNLYSRSFPSQGITLYYSYIDIIAATEMDSGRYECLIPGSTSRRSNLDLEIIELSCSQFSTGNGLSVSYDNSNKVSSWATFYCSNNAKLVGEKYSLCQHDGTWSAPQPYCEETDIRCPIIDGKGIFTFKYENDRKINSTALIFCKEDGKRIEGCNRLTCLSNRTWSGSDAACVDYSACTRFSSSPDLEVVYSRGISVGSNASFICLPPKVLVGKPYALCQDDGTWSNSQPTCEEPRCSIRVLSEEIANFDAEPVMTGVNEEYMPVGFEVDLTCGNSLVISGNSKARCGSLGKWELGHFECAPGCILELDPSSDISIQPLKPGYQLGDLILLSCPQGKEMTDNVKRMACLGSKWSHSVPSCIESEYSDSSGL